MTGRIYTTVFTVPAHTLPAAPVTQPVALDDEILDTVEIVIPDGHAALTGIAVLWSGVQIAPYVAGQWVSGDGDKISYDYNGEITAAGLSLAGYNTDVYQHTFYLRWYMSLRGSQLPVVIDSAQASGTQSAAAVNAITSLAGTVTATEPQPATVPAGPALVPAVPVVTGPPATTPAVPLLR